MAKKAVAETVIGASDDADADVADNELGAIRALESTPDSFLGKVARARKAVIAAVVQIGVLAVLFGFGDAETWAAVAATVGSILTVAGVFYATNDDV